MPEYGFSREVRTQQSEAYTIESDGEAVGRVDIHFAQSGVVQATLCVPPEFDDEEIEELIAEIDERLVLSAEILREDFLVTVWRGERAGVYSEETEDDLEEDSNGSGPRLL